METILVVEDDHAAQKILKHLFESEGYNVETSADGQSALEVFRAADPTAIILDLRWPVVPGKDVCREIRKQSSTLPIVVLSAVTEEAVHSVGQTSRSLFSPLHRSTPADIRCSKLSDTTGCTGLRCPCALSIRDRLWRSFQRRWLEAVWIPGVV